LYFSENPYKMYPLPLKIVIADDHQLIREGLTNALHKNDSLKVLGQATNGQELVELVKEFQPDVVLTDIKMPILNGIEATRKIKAINPDIEVVGLSFIENEFAIVELLEAGALGYASKSSSIDEIIEAISKVYNKIPFYCSTTTAFLEKEIAVSSFNPYRRFKPIFTEQEIRVIRCITKGMTSQQISDYLGITVRTVDAHRRNILCNLKLKTPIGIMIYAIKNNLIAIDELPDVCSI
jgi:two-component system, NarL family, response regulator NreC